MKNSQKKNCVLQKYTIEDKIFQTNNSGIYTGFEIATGNPVIIKQIPRKNIGKFIQKVPAEIYYHYQAYECSPDLVVKPLDWFERYSCYILVLEKMDDAVDLYDFTKIYGIVSEKVARIIWDQIVHCVQDLTKSGIVHRDIKDENILINPKTLQIKMIDFGCATESKYFDDEVICGTPVYWPIECFEKNIYKSGPTTVWSLGAVLYILLCGEWNFQNGVHVRNFKAENKLSPDVVTLFNSVFCTCPTKRISLQQIMGSKWLVGRTPYGSYF